MNKLLQERILQNLAELESLGLTRELLVPHGIDLSSNDYLGLARDSRLKVSAVRAVRDEGVGATGSRLLRGHRDSFSEVEKQFAEFKGAEDSLYFSSGYLANLGMLKTFIEETDLVFSDELNHASLIDGIRLTKARKRTFAHCNPETVKRMLSEAKTEGQKFLVTESLFSMDGTIAPLDKYAEICRNTGTNLIVDEAHAVGIYGAGGSGLIEEFGIQNDVFLSMNSAGKALGVSGGFVAGEAPTIEYLRQKARSFIFSTAPLPLTACVLQKSIEIVRKEKERREKLLNLSRFFRELLSQNGIKECLKDCREVSPIIPIIIGDSKKAVKIAQSLQSDGFDVRAIRPPTVPVGTARLRVSLNVNLSEEILREFSGSLQEALCED